MATLPLVAGPEVALRAFAAGSGLLLAWITAALCAFALAGAASDRLRQRDMPLALPYGLGLLAELWRLA
jgi:hypothetical protein